MCLLFLPHDHILSCAQLGGTLQMLLLVQGLPALHVSLAKPTHHHLRWHQLNGGQESLRASSHLLCYEYAMYALPVGFRVQTLGFAPPAGVHSPYAVLDKLVPGYYHRRTEAGEVCNSTCCNNTATEHAMAERLVVDDLVHWARAYKACPPCILWF